MDNLKMCEQMLILKAVADYAKDIYAENSNFILNQVLKTEDEKIKNEFGTLWKKKTEAKNVFMKIRDNEAKIAELKAENEELAKQPLNAIITDSKIILMSKHSEVADDKAIELLQNLIANLPSKRLNKSASKAKRQ